MGFWSDVDAQMQMATWTAVYLCHPFLGVTCEVLETDAC